MSKYGKPVWQYVLEAAEEFEGRTFTPMDIIRKIQEKNPGIPEVTIRCHVIGMAPNHPSSKYYPSLRTAHGAFSYLGTGHFQLSTEVTENNPCIEEISDAVEEDIGTAIHLEEDLEAYVFKNLKSVEEGLRPYNEESGRQFSIDSGRIDILATDEKGSFVVLELKAGIGNDAVLTQVLSYMATIKKDLVGGKGVRGIIIAHDFSDRLVSATSLLQNVKLMKYKAKFDFEVV